MRVIESASESKATNLIEGIVKLFTEAKGEALVVGTDVYTKLFKDHPCFIATDGISGKFTLGTTAVFTITLDEFNLRTDEGLITGENEVRFLVKL